MRFFWHRSSPPHRGAGQQIVSLKRRQCVVAPRVLSAALVACALLAGSAVSASATLPPMQNSSGVRILLPSGPATGPEGFWTVPAAVTLVPEGPGTIYYRFGAGPGTWTRCDGPVIVPEGKQVLSVVLMSPDNRPGDVTATTIRSDFSVTPVAGVGAPPSSPATYSEADQASGGVKVRARVRAQVGTTVRRLGGRDRFDVASLVADTTFGTADTVIVASGEKFPDALTAAGLAGCLKSPMLLVQHDKVPAQIATRIRELGATRAIVCGGPLSVNSSVITALKAQGLTVERIDGKDRYEVAANTAQRIASGTGGGGRVYIARGDIYPDALSLSPLAYAQRTPILLTPTGRLTASTRAQLARGGYSSARIAGGTNSVSADVATAIAKYVPDTRRWGGGDRYAVAVNVATQAVAQESNSWRHVGVAKGTVFSDALCGGVSAGHLGGIILLTAPEPLTSVTQDALTAHAGDVETCDIYGGPASITPTTYEQIRGIFR